MANRPQPRSGDAGAFQPRTPPSESAFASSAKASEPGATDRRPLPPEPAWVRFDDELDGVCRVAAQVGGSQPAPISYTALIIALLWSDDAVSQWFRGFIAGEPGLDLDAIYRSKAVDEKDRERFRAEAASGALPAADPLYSRSARNLLDQAARIATEVSQREPEQIVLGTRHLMAAYAFRNPSDHVDQVRGWGFDADRWRDAFLKFMLGQGAREGEDWTRLGRRPGRGGPMIGSFTSDDPLARPSDLLDVEDEAAAFARIAAARDVVPPLAIGVFGDWGSGKTFFMRLIHDEVALLSAQAERRRDAQLATGPFLPDIVQIRFNAWHYIETNLWASLVEYIFTELDRWLQDRTRDHGAGAEQVFDRLATAQRLKIEALDQVIARRAEQRSAEQRAARARREYDEALMRASEVGAGAYARALMDSLLQRPEVGESVAAIGNSLGMPQLADSSGRVLEVLEQARTESGRARLAMRAGIARLGSWRWMASIAVVLLGVPALAVAGRDAVAALLGWPGLARVHEAVLAASGALAGLAAWGGALVRRAGAAVGTIDAFDRRLRGLTEQEIAKARSGRSAAGKDAAEEDMRQRRQALEAAERALAGAEARLAEARSDFENATARSRLNAFIRAKATEGDYAKHLGIIAAIRRDFGQLAVLMGAADNAADRAERERLSRETQAVVLQFLDRLAAEPDARLTAAEARSLLTLLEPSQALGLLDAGAPGNVRARFVDWLGSEDTLASVEASLRAIGDAPLPKFSRIILYIDDLDRCPPQVVVDVLQAVHLLLCFPLFTVVVAVDARWVSRALHERFPKLLGETGPFAGAAIARPGAGASSHDYLEKIFQIPYWVRPVDAAGAQRYVNQLVAPDVERSAASAAAADAASGGPAAVGPAPSSTGSTPGTATPPTRGPAAAEAPATPAPTAAAVGLELTRWEADALERFAPLIGATPRRLIRFINLYRLIKTGLSGDARERLVGESGQSDAYRALIVQLAIVTGAPDAAAAYFVCLAAMPAGDAVGAVHERLEHDPAFKNGRDHAVVLRVLQSARDWPGTALRVDDLRLTAATVRRYSFTAWNA